MSRQHQSRMRFHRRAAGLCACGAAALLAAWPAAAAKIDTVELINGNLVTGEIKELNHGKLKYSTDSMGTVYIEWDEITRLTGLGYYRLETTRGRLLFGSIRPGPRDGTIEVTDGGEPLTLDMLQVVLIRPIEANWREKTDSTLRAGYSYTKSSDVEEYSVAYDAVYVDERYRLNFGVNGRHTDDGEDRTSQGQAYTTYRHWLENQNYWLLTGAGERNDELGLDLRLIGGGGFGHRFWRNNTSMSFGEAAAVVNHTENSDGSSDTEIEALFRGGWEIYIHRTPKRTLNAVLALFPGLTEFGEYRTDLQVSLRQELIEDFFLDFSIYHQFDSDVSDDDASSSDYGVSTSVGFEF